MVVWLCHARVGHRQGLYIEQPSPETVGVFLWLWLLWRPSGATCNRSPSGLVLNNPHRKRWGFFFVCGCFCALRARAATGHRQGLVLNNPHRKRWGFFFGCCCRDRRSRAATGHRQGLVLNNPHRKRWGFFFVCGCCCAHRARAATGHRQGLYVERPSPETVGVPS